ncbi:MAG: DUF835 domain-containing protein, partial [Methanomassiliicoccales archaeon]
MMAGGDAVCSVASIAWSFLGLLLGLYVVLRNPRAPIAQAFFATMVMGVFTGLFSFFTNNSTGETMALGFARIGAFFFVLQYAGYLFLATQLPYEDREVWVWRHIGLFALLMISLAMIPSLSLSSVESLEGAWLVSGQLGTALLFAILLGLAGGGAIQLSKSYERHPSPQAKVQCVLLGVVIFIPLFYWLLLHSLGPGGLLSGLGPLGYLIPAPIFAYGIIRHHMFLIDPRVEEGLVKGESEGKGVREVRGSCLLVREGKPVRSYRMFREALSQGAEGLVFSRSHPDLLRERYGLERTPVIWLANQPGQDRLEPSNLSILHRMISDFISRSEDPVIMLDGLEYLISNNSTGEVLRLVYR